MNMWKWTNYILYMFIISVLTLFPTVLMYEISCIRFYVNGFVEMVQLLLSPGIDHRWSQIFQASVTDFVTDGHRFFRLLLSNCVNWKIYCDDHSSLSSTTTVQKWIISYTSHHRWYCLSVVFFLFILFLCYFAVPFQKFSKEQWQVIITK